MTATTSRSRAKPPAKTGHARVVPPGFVLLFAVVVVLNLIGLVMVLSASSVTALHQQGSSYYYFERQLLWLALGSVAFVVALRTDYHRLRLLAWPLLLVSGGLLVVVLLPGGGSHVKGSL